MRGERIREMRERRGISQDELSARTGISKKDISRYENDKSMPGADYLGAIAKALNVSSDYLLGFIDEPLRPLTERDLSPDELKLLDKYRNGEFVQMIKILADQSLSQMPDQAGVASSKPALHS